MTQVIIKKLDIENFKGFSKLVKYFDNKKELIEAKNGAGKTTLKSAWFWLLGFNIADIIPSINNKEIPNLAIKVEAEVEIDGVLYTFKRTQNEIWKTNKDTGIEEKSNNESKMFIDNNEFIQRNYKEKIGSLFGVNYDKLQMVCEKEFFNANTVNWKWTNRRKELFELCEINSLLTNLTNNEKFNLIANDIEKGFSTTEIKKTIKRELKGFAEEKERNLILITDKQNEISKYSNVDFNSLEIEKLKIEEELTQLQLNNSKQSVNTELSKLEEERAKLNLKLLELQRDNVKAKSEIEGKVNSLSVECQQIKSKGEGLKSEIEESKKVINSLEGKNKSLESENFQGKTTCPVCLQELPKSRIEQAKTNFETAKVLNIKANKEQIENNKSYITSLEDQLKNLRETYQNLSSEYSAQLKILKDFTEKDSSEIKKNITLFEEKIKEIKETINNKQEIDLTIGLKQKINQINEQLAYKKVIENIKLRVEELKNESKKITDKEMLSKQKVKQLDLYIQEQVNLVTETINSKFQNVKFSLFNELYASSEHEIEEECVCLMNGKTYDEMSYGERFLADLEVVKTLQREYKINLPLFLDNAECVTSEYVADQQLIELFAKKDKNINGIKIENIL